LIPFALLYGGQEHLVHGLPFVVEDVYVLGVDQVDHVEPFGGAGVCLQPQLVRVHLGGEGVLLHVAHRED